MKAVNSVRTAFLNKFWPFFFLVSKYQKIYRYLLDENSVKITMKWEIKKKLYVNIF